MKNVNTDKKCCTLCLKSKKLLQFDRYSSGKGRHKRRCRDCETERRILKEKSLRKCINCEQIGNVENFLVDSRRNAGNVCEDCAREGHNALVRRLRTKHRKRNIIARIRHRAQINNIPFNLEENDIIIPEFCPVLGIPLFFNDGTGHPEANTPSIDRLIPEKGYIKENVAVISQRANQIKNSGSADEHEKIAKWMRDNGCK